MAKYGYTESKPAVLKRLNRAEGQVRGIAKMVEDDRYCIDILTQISAARAALDKVAIELVREHTKHCLIDDEIGTGGVEGKADELVDAIERLMNR
jgi:DNA-binding FrmR family transcriptional regulator